MPRARPPLADKSTNEPAGPQHASNAGYKQLVRSLKDFLEEIDHEVEERCAKIMDMEQTAIQELRERLTALVMGLASKTRSMSLVAFREQSANPAEDMGQGNARVPPGGSVAATPEPQSRGGHNRGQVAGASIADMPSVGRTTRKRARELAAGVIEQPVPDTGGRALRPRQSHSQAMATPVSSHIRGSSSTAATPATVRLPRPNEAVFSFNGSPIGSFQDGLLTPLGFRPPPHATPMLTGISRPRGEKQSEESGPAISIDLGGGRALQIKSAQDLDALDSDLKRLAYEQVEAMNAFTARLTSRVSGAK